jgi:diguanylate cyclase (GGDEF)-like protein
MPNTDLEGAQAVAERLLNDIGQTVVEHRGASVRLSCSIGVAVCRPGVLDQASQLVREADQALYQAKQDGRGRVRSHGSVTSLAEASAA